MAATSRPVGSIASPMTSISEDDEAEQRRYYDQRVQTWPVRVGALVIGFLWFTQLLWKLPWNNFGSAGAKPNGVTPNPTPGGQQPGPFLDNGDGLYHWMTVEASNGNKVLPFYGDLIKNVVLPNWQLVAWMTLLMEAAIMALLLLGLLSRLGGVIALLQSINLYLGLSQAPGEWYWTYGMLVALSFIFAFTGSGRVWGIDQWLRPRLRAQIAAGNRMARWLYLLT